MEIYQQILRHLKDNEKYARSDRRRLSKYDIESTMSTEKGIDEIIIYNMESEDLQRIISELPEIQKRRLILYYFHSLTLEQIAEQEHCTKVSIKNCIDVIIKTIRKKLKKF